MALSKTQVKLFCALIRQLTALVAGFGDELVLKRLTSVVKRFDTLCKAKKG